MVSNYSELDCVIHTLIDWFSGQKRCQENAVSPLAASWTVESMGSCVILTLLSV